jgi:hypothetical protein
MELHPLMNDQNLVYLDLIQDLLHKEREKRPSIDTVLKHPTFWELKLESNFITLMGAIRDYINEYYSKPLLKALSKDETGKKVDNSLRDPGNEPKLGTESLETNFTPKNLALGRELNSPEKWEGVVGEKGWGSRLDDEVLKLTFEGNPKCRYLLKYPSELIRFIRNKNEHPPGSEPSKGKNGELIYQEPKKEDLEARKQYIEYGKKDNLGFEEAYSRYFRDKFPTLVLHIYKAFQKVGLEFKDGAIK